MKEIKSSILSSFGDIEHGVICCSEDFNFQNGNLSIFREIRTLDQIHSDKVIHLNGDELDNTKITGDAMYTLVTGTCLGIYTADCVPVILYEPERNVIAAIHAGWRGTVSRITGKAIQDMQGSVGFDPGSAYAIIGPSIGNCCYEVDRDVASQFVENFTDHGEYVNKTDNGKYIVDLVEANISQLKDQGIGYIEAMHICTMCNEDIPSYRRDGRKTGKIFSYIGLV